MNREDIRAGDTLVLDLDELENMGLVVSPEFHIDADEFNTLLVEVDFMEDDSYTGDYDVEVKIRSSQDGQIHYDWVSSECLSKPSDAGKTLFEESADLISLFDEMGYATEDI